MSKKDIQLNIRITQELKDRIDESARRNNRSINAEAITLITQSLDANGVSASDNIDLISTSAMPDLSIFSKEKFNAEIRQLITEKTNELKKSIEDEACRAIESIINEGMKK